MIQTTQTILSFFVKSVICFFIAVFFVVTYDCKQLREMFQYIDDGPYLDNLLPDTRCYCWQSDKRDELKSSTQNFPYQRSFCG